MPPQAAPAGDAEASESGQSWQDRLWSVGKSLALFFAIQYAMRQFMGSGSSTQTPAPEKVVPVDSGAASSTDGGVDYSIFPAQVYPLWPSNVSVDVNMYISPSVVMPSFSAMPAGSLVVHERAFGLEKSKNDFREVHAEFDVPRTVQNNGTLWAHIFVGQHGAELDPASPQYDASKAYRMLRPLTDYLSKKKVHKKRNLLDSSTEGELEEVIEEESKGGPAIASYYHPNLTLSFIPDSGAPVLGTLHPAVRQFYTLDANNGRDASGKNGFYYPVLYHNTFWQLRSHMTELNTTHPTPRLEMNVRISTLANWQFNLMASMDEGMKETARKAARGETTPGGGDGSEMELIKETLLDTNPWLLGTTVIVSIFHMIFEMLAFKSDVGHWRKKKDNVGVSVRTILSNVVMQTIIFLYLLDNNEHTSWMILFGQGIGIAIEAWKVTKAVNVRVREPVEGSWAYGKLPVVVAFEDKHTLSETEEKTEEYDRIAFKWMGIVAVPLLGAYAVYSLFYESHKSWYSFIITTLVGSVYAYGFLMMVPSLYINYRLHSVAHMPAKAMTYKFLNTFIDDLFAFTIKMPLLHRLATLRDDVIFFVYIYQAWAYKVDYTRVNEFGQGGDEDEVGGEKEGMEEKLAGRPLKAPAGAKRERREGEEEVVRELDVNGEGGGRSSGKDAGGGGRKRKA
ncbi:hypothetical protein LTR37_019544 [Vermiconidia calcicola]|uniref:Uncharacterized protein n=1 Tax=Vermiconidia calcicola TaxID=1690605 RepID=A0ACC3MDS4_9PEZI|nr:hypothetical protein LTR37_019544 [Vermiconidia calcicola]